MALESHTCGRSSAGRARASQARGRGFEARRPLFFPFIEPKTEEWFETTPTLLGSGSRMLARRSLTDISLSERGATTLVPGGLCLTIRRLYSSGVPLGLTRGQVWFLTLGGLCVAAGSWLQPWYELKGISEYLAGETFWNTLGWVAVVLVVAVVAGLGALASMYGNGDYQPRARWLVWLGIIGLGVAVMLSIYRTATPPTIADMSGFGLGPTHPSDLKAGTFPYLSDAGLLMALVGLWLLRPRLVIPVAVTGNRRDQAQQTSPGALETPTDQPIAAASDVKACPDCAETVKVAARVCKYCGFRFEAN